MTYKQGDKQGENECRKQGAHPVLDFLAFTTGYEALGFAAGSPWKESC